MKEGDVVIIPMPQSDASVKNRPTLVLREMPPFGDMLVCGLSTQLHQAAKELDEIIATKDSDFSMSGLKAESLVRLGFLAVVPRKNIIGSIGSIAADRRIRLLKKLSDYLVK